MHRSGQALLLWSVLMGATSSTTAQKEAPEPSTLIEAAAIGDEFAVRQFLDEGADINAQGKDGGTALMRAALGGHIETVRMLLAAGADPSIRTEDGWSAMRLAISVNHQDIVTLLRKPQLDMTDAMEATEESSSMEGAPANLNELEAPVLLEQFAPQYPETAHSRKAKEMSSSRSSLRRPARLLQNEYGAASIWNLTVSQWKRRVFGSSDLRNSMAGLSTCSPR
jgi:ankyrin repeat protein